MRCVKPSMAIVSPSWTRSAIASRRLANRGVIGLGYAPLLVGHNPAWENRTAARGEALVVEMPRVLGSRAMKPPPCSGLRRVARLEDLVERDKDHDCAGYGAHHVCVRVDAVAELPSRLGRFQIVAFWNNRDGKDHV